MTPIVDRLLMEWGRTQSKCRLSRSLAYTDVFLDVICSQGVVHTCNLFGGAAAQRPETKLLPLHFLGICSSDVDRFWWDWGQFQGVGVCRHSPVWARV